MVSASRRAVRRMLQAGGTLLLLVVAWMALSGGVAQLPRAHALGQRLETVVQIACGVLSLLALLTSVWARGWGRAVRIAWIVSLMMTAGLSSLVWGSPSLMVGVLFAVVALLVARAILWLLRASLTG